MPIRRALALVVGTALGVIGLLLGSALLALGLPAFDRGQVGLGTYLDIVKIVLAVVAGIGGVVALVVTYRRQRTGERAEQREHTRLLNERFGIASEQLGGEKQAVRLAGVHALASLADDWNDGEGRQMCIDVLCSYLRMAEAAKPKHDTVDDSGSGTTDGDQDSEATTPKPLDPDRETCHTILRTIAAHLRKGGATVSWSGHDFDLRGITIDLDLDFTAAELNVGTLNLARAHFADGEISFESAKFTGSDVLFTDATFTGGLVWFGRTHFADGEISFDDAQFAGGQLFFGDAKFTGGHVFFDGVRLSDGSLFFGDAQFSGSDVRFSRMELNSGTIRFVNAQFMGGRVAFYETHFGGSEVDFGFTHFVGGEVDFSTCTWQEPPRWLPESATGLTLPPDTAAAARSIC